MKKAYIHIGSGKTGTTTIQSSLFNSNLDKYGIGYPTFSAFPKAENQNCLAILFRDREKLPRVYQKYSQDEYLEFKKSIEIELHAQLKKYDKIVISAELIGSFSRNEVISFNKYLLEHDYTDIYILIYIRNPVHYYLSLVQQTIKASHIFPNPISFKYNFKNSIETWMKIFSNLTVKLFDEEIKKNDGLLKVLKQNYARILIYK